jgi:tetratricopeptide (TPR) repeat protein
MGLTTTLNPDAGVADQHGVPTSAPAEAVAVYDRAIDRLLRYHPDVVPLAMQLSEEHADTAIANILLAYLHLMSTDEPDVAVARDAWQAMQSTPMNEREQIHHAAIGAWSTGDWIGASRALDDLVTRWPADVLAMVLGHQLDFFVGDAANLRDRPSRALRDLDPDHPHTAFVRGMQAFGLEESGHYERAEAAGQAALAVNPDDVWATHAVVHTHEMRGSIDTGIKFLESTTDDWSSGNLFTVHSWWHLALFYLEAGAVDRVLAIYDAEVHNAESDGIPLEMLDASALLWRLLLDGHDTGGRFDALADAWASRAEGPRWYAFNDLHAVMAQVGAGRISDAEKVVERLAGYVHCGGAGTNVAMTAEIGLPASRAVVRFAQGRDDEVIAELAPIRRVLNLFGGSHAQRDALQRTLLESSLRAGQHDLARALLSERLELREDSVYGWTQRARLLRALDQSDAATAAAERARVTQRRFAAAIA